MRETPPGRTEVYGDPIKFRLAAEYWRITDDLIPRMLAGAEYLKYNKVITLEWVATMNQLYIIELTTKYAILGFRSLLSREDSSMIKPFEECMAMVVRRSGRNAVVRGIMDGRAERYARRALELEDISYALFLQSNDLTEVAFKNKMWDVRNMPSPGAPQI